MSDGQRNRPPTLVDKDQSAVSPDHMISHLTWAKFFVVIRQSRLHKALHSTADISRRNRAIGKMKTYMLSQDRVVTVKKQQGQLSVNIRLEDSFEKYRCRECYPFLTENF